MRRHGSKGQVLMDASDGSPAGSPFSTIVVASLNKWSLDQARDKAEVTSFGDTNKVYVQGLPDTKGSLGGFWDDDDLSLFDAAAGDDPVFLHLVPSTLNPTLLFKGSAYLDMSIDVMANGAISVSGSFVAAGAWTRGS